MPATQRDQLLADLRTNVIEVIFTKKDGSTRVMKATLNPDILPPAYKEGEISEEKEFHKENPDNIAVWDIEAKGWRSFNISSLISAQMILTP